MARRVVRVAAVRPWLRRTWRRGGGRASMVEKDEQRLEGLRAGEDVTGRNGRQEEERPMGQARAVFLAPGTAKKLAKSSRAAR